jgi:hypothetical protein
MTSDAETVHDRWRAREAPYGDFIVYADGSLSVMAHGWSGDRVPSRADRWWWQEELRATAWTATDWLDVDLTLATHTFAGHRALCGESAAHGGVGWVALTRDDPAETLEWLAVSLDANPFARVRLDPHTLTAATTLGLTWRFPRTAPHEVAIERTHPDDGGHGFGGPRR